MNNELNREEIGKRLEQFASSRYVLLKDFAAIIGVASSNLKTHYFTGKNLPGAEMLARLLSIGCDLHWLFYGKRTGVAEKDTVEFKVKKLEKKIKELERENTVLRDSIIQISTILRTVKKSKKNKTH